MFVEVPVLIPNCEVDCVELVDPKRPPAVGVVVVAVLVLNNDG